ncbi:hypothetical protein DXG01_012042 [Tephrocybe rancida]|nr:hypothetical protein DXG01_012042 [Tephrocybe rancida]
MKASAKDTVMRPATTCMPRNLCAIDWVREHPGGKRSEFQAYFNQLSAADKKVYDDKATAAKTGQKKKK